MNKIINKLKYWYYFLFKKQITKEVTLMYLNKINLNGRMYTTEIVKPAIEVYNNKHSHYGEIGYTEYYNVTLENISHEVTNVYIDGNEVKGTIITLNTSKGRELTSFINDVVFRPKSNGTVEDNIVVNLEIFSFNAVLKNDDAFSNCF